MKKNILILSIGIILYTHLFISTQFTHAFSKNPEELSHLIREYVDKNYDITDRFPVYNSIRNRIRQKIDAIDSSETTKIQYLKDLTFYNNNNILDIVSYITSREGALLRFKKWKKEGIDILENQEKSIRSEQNIHKDILYVNKTNEFTQDGEIYRISYKKVSKIHESRLSSYKNMPGKLFYKESIGYLYTENISTEKKISFVEIIQSGDDKFLFYNDNYFIENNDIYTYEYDTFFNINSNYGIYKSDIEKSGTQYKDVIFVRLQDAKNNIVLSPKKRKISSRGLFDKIESNNENFHNFINQSTPDVLRDSQNYESTLVEIYNLGKSLTRGLTDENDKIKAIYDWMVQNIEYPNSFDINDWKIFSGLEAYKNKSAVCEGQASLMYYLLQAGGVQDVEIITGYVIDSPDFPKIGHAWIQIGNYFYDPSFETIVQESVNNYNYYKIPYDLIYTNRYNIRDIPPPLLDSGNIDSENIKKEIRKQRLKLLKKYNRPGTYNLLNEFHLLEKLNLTENDTISLISLSEKLPSYDIEIKNGKINSDIFGTEIEYFPITNENQDLNLILKKIYYNIDGYSIVHIYENDFLIGHGLTNSIK